MLKSITTTLFLAIFVILPSSSQHRILLDESESDWDLVQSAWTSTSSSNGISLNSFKVTNDEQFLFIYFKSDNTYSLQSTSGVTIYIDSDNNSSTGLAKDSIGAEIAFNFGQRSGTAYLNNNQHSISFSDLFMVTTPTIESDWFEVALSRNAVVNNIDVFTAGEIKLILSDESVVNGAQTDVVSYSFANGSLNPLPEYSFSKKAAEDLRVISHNVEFDSFFEEAKKPAYQRLYQTINPDIIGFSEIYNHSGIDVANRLEEMLPSPTGKQWKATNIQDNFVATRYTIKNSWAAGGFGNGAFLLDLRPDYNTDALVVVAHPPCCDNDANRQIEVDAIMAFIREAKQPGGDLALNDSTPIIIMGDMNFVGKQQQVTTLLTGDIVDEINYGNDFNPDWGGSAFLDAKPFVTNLPMTFTYGIRTNPGSYSKGRLDYIIYSGSVLDLQNSFVLYTNELSQAQLNANGLLYNDTESASDHFPVVSDFKVTVSEYQPPATIASLRKNNAMGIPELDGTVVTVSGTVTVDQEYGTSGPAYFQDKTGGLGIFGSEFAALFSAGDSIVITSKLGHFRGLTQLVYDAASTNVEVLKSNITTQPKIVTVQDILNQTWNGVEEYEGRLVKIENATISDTGVFQGNSNYTLTDVTGSLNIRIDSDVNLVGAAIPTGTIAISGILSQFDFSEPYSEGYQLMPYSVNQIEESGASNKITKENLVLHYAAEDGLTANIIATQLQDKLDYFKRYSKSRFYANEKIFTITFAKDQAEFNANKPANVQDFETSYITENGEIYFVEPTTTAQLNFLESVEQAAMFGLAKAVIKNEYAPYPIEDWMVYGFASVITGLEPTPSFMKQQVQSLGRIPKASELNDWENITEFDKYAFAHTAAEFIWRKFTFNDIRYLVQFNTLSFNFWSIKDEAKFNEVWSKYLDLFYLNTDVMQVQESTANFTVFAANIDKEYAVEYAALLEETLARYSTQLEFTLKQKTQMFIYPSLCDYHNSVGVDVCNPNSIGGGVGIDMFIMVTPREIPRPVEKIHALAMHEFAHVFQFNIYPTFLPPWMSEGFASFLPGGILTKEGIDALRPQVRQGFDQMFARTGRYPTVDDLSDRNIINQYNLDYYLLGQVMVDFIVKDKGFIALKEFVKTGGVDFTKLGYTDKIQFQNAWFQFYENTYKIDAPAKSIEAKKTPSAISIDGNITEAVWDISEPIEKNLFGVHNNTATFGVLWDDNYLYVAAKILDNVLINDGGANYENDGVEVYIDADFNKGTTYDSYDRQFRKNYNETGLVELSGKTDGVLHSVQNITGGYTIELAIPWSNLNINGIANTTIGFDIANNDDDSGGNKDNQIVWNGVADNWKNTKFFGELTLSNKLAVGLEDFISEIPNETILYQNYPNPFNPTTTINYALPEASHVKLIVYDVLGKTIATLENNVQAAGNYTVNFDASHLNNGVYIYVLETENFRCAKKLTLLK